MIKIFISHSTYDAAIAGRLAELFRTAMRLSKSEIRCTSVDGYRLPAGANTDGQLRREVLDAPVLVGLISHHSFESAYVLFELGAHWGKNAFMAPVLAPGVSASILKGPLSALNALGCDSASQIHQLVHDVALQLNTQLEPASAYHDLVESVTARSPRPQEHTAPDASTEQRAHTPTAHGDDPYVGADRIIKRHCESQWHDDYSMRIYCEEQQRNAVEKLRGQSREGVPDDAFRRIRENSARDWPEDFEMQLYTENQQLTRLRLRPTRYMS